MSAGEIATGDDTRAQASVQEKPKRKLSYGKRLEPSRLRMVDRLLKRCVPAVEVARRLSGEWDLSERMIYRYIERVYRDWKKDAESRPSDKEMIRYALCEIVTKAMMQTEPNLKAATIALDRLARLGGHYIERHEVVNASVTFSPQQIENPEAVRARILELMQRVKPRLLPVVEMKGEAKTG